MSNRTSIDICVCTFHRDHIVTTLQSLAKLDIAPDWDVRIIVADNDDTPSAETKVKDASVSIPFPVVYIHAPARNISVARNACLDATSADYIAFIDDDETAPAHWLKELIQTAETEKSAAVLGPVDPVFNEDYPSWMVKGQFHATRPVWVNGRIITGYTCNLLLDRRVPEFQNLRFRPELGRTGGEDTVFLSTISSRGGKIAYAERALLTEPVPEGRASLPWLMKRRFRSGQTHAILILENQQDTISTRVKNIIIASGKLAVCGAMTLLHLPFPVKSISWALRGCIHCGVIARLTGKKELVQYG